LNECLYMIWCSINVCELWIIWNDNRDIVSWDTHVEIVKMYIIWGFELRMYSDSTCTLDLSVDKDYRVAGGRVEGGSYSYVRCLKYELIGIGNMD